MSELTDDPEGYVLLGFPDLQGTVRGKGVRPAAFAKAVAEGTTMTNLLLALDPADEPIGTYETIGIRSGAEDLIVRPELDTLRELAWLPGWRICLATPMWTDERSCELASREVLRIALDRIGALGYEVRAAFEYELRLRDADSVPVSSGISYSVGEISRIHGFLSALEPALAGLEIKLDAVHTEAGKGLIELNLAPGSGIQAADDATLLKFATKEVAAAMGMSASFMAKPVTGEEGSSGHIHLSLWSGEDNAFAASGGEGHGLGPVASPVLAGILGHLPAASLALNPTVNSYKRLVPGWFAPVNATWGFENRSAAVRAIRSDAHPSRCRLECRRPGADANPYLALAALVASAVDGLQAGSTPPSPIEGDATAVSGAVPLPSSLSEALSAWRADETLRSALGETFSDYYATSREWELRAWQQAVTEWERDRYEHTV